jgi:UDP-sulfoquinovose synthase
MRIFIAGIDGYLGWPLAQTLAARGHEVAGADLFLRRQWVAEMGGASAIPVAQMRERVPAFRERFGRDLLFREGDLTQYSFVRHFFEDFQPEAIVHLGEMPSAPYSMTDVAHAVFTHQNNLTGTLNILHAMRDVVPHAHLVKLGTMGEYGTPPIDIPEGFFEVEFRGRKARLPFPKQANSWYHLTKVHDSNNVMFACRVWGLAATDVMQGVVYGTRILETSGDERMATRLDFDQCFGTAINRFCCQLVIGEPITPFGKGHQKRGFLPLRDSMQCLTLAIEKPPLAGEYRVLNQFAQVYDITELAGKVADAGRAAGLRAEIQNVDNPRTEAEDHEYKPDHQGLFDLGYRPTLDIDGEIRTMLADILPHRARILAHKAALMPDIRWNGERRKSEALDGRAPLKLVRRP